MVVELANAQAHKIVVATYASKAGQINVEFDAPLAAPAPSVTVHDGNKNEVMHSVPTFAAGGSKVVEIHLTKPFPKNVADVVFPSVSFMDGSVQTSMTDQVLQGNAAVSAIISVMSKVPQTQEEKNIFASGLVTTASTGNAGAGDINLNSPDLLKSILNSDSPNALLKGFMQLKRSTTSAGDPKNFEAGISYQSAIALTGKAARTIPAILFDFAGKTEGTASQFGVDNLVGDASVALQSPVWDLGQKSSAKLRIVGGFEGGSNRSNGNAPVSGTGLTPLRNVDWLARSKVGFEGALKYTRDAQSPLLPFETVELTAGLVNRFLLFDELQFDQTTQAVNRITHGNRTWADVHLKLFLGHTDSANYGLKLTYENGSLPPVFANVKAFQFGFLYETKDRTGK